jgi:hypothetical protein
VLLIGVGLRNRLGLIGGGSVAGKARPFFTAAGEAPVPDAEKDPCSAETRRTALARHSTVSAPWGFQIKEADMELLLQD